MDVDLIAGDLMGFKLWSPLEHAVSFLLNDEMLNFSVSYEKNTAYVSDGYGCYTVRQRNGAWWHREKRVPLAKRIGSSVWVFEGGGIVFELCEPLSKDKGKTAAANAVFAPMPGLVTHIAVKKGQTLQKGDKIVVLEAMKMEHSLVAPSNCEVEEVLVSEGDQVEAAAELVCFKMLGART